MAIEDQLRERLRKVEALLLGAATAGEREAAGAARERLKARLADAARQDPPIELKLTVPDSWSVRLLLALCRRHGLKPYRYARQRRTTVMVRAPRQFFDAVVWRQFVELHADLSAYFEQSTETLIRAAVHADTAEADIVPEPATLR